MKSLLYCHCLKAFMTTVLGVSIAASTATAADSRQVQQAIDHGRDYLFRTEKNGNWEGAQSPDLSDTQAYSVRNGQWGGMTAIATLALLACGVDGNDPHIQSAVAFLRSAELKGNYALGVRAQVWNQLTTVPWLHRAALADCDQLERGMHTTRGESAGFYGYLTASKSAEYDHSVSQFAVLGMWAAAQAGCEVPTTYWSYVENAWHRHQAADGTWDYYAHVDPNDGPRLSMTAAGVATLFLAQEYTRLAPRTAGNVEDPGIDAGLKYLGQHLTELTDDRRWYTLFGISRVGLASGYKRLGTTDWYDWGSGLAVHDQRPDGSWNNRRENENVNGVADTAFALLFLSRGRAPVMINKLCYDVTSDLGVEAGPGTWNQRPRDIANLSRWVGAQIESPLNWQIVSLHDPDSDLHDAPILYLAGSQAPRLSPDDVAKLRAYCEDGGLILGNADGGSEAFARGFERLGEQLFPGRHFRILEPLSPIYTDEALPRDHWPSKPSVKALTNGTRELMVLLATGDPARIWQGQTFQPLKKDSYGQLMVDLFLYSTDMQGLRHRGETYMVNPRPNTPASKPVRIARIKYSGNWDPEPGGWRRLSNVLHNDGVAELEIRTVDPTSAGGNGLTASSFQMASLTVASDDFRLSNEVRENIRQYVTTGGTLLVDVAGGRSLYRFAAEQELAKMFPNAPRQLPILPPESPVYATLMSSGGQGISVSYRHFERPAGALHRPQLRGLQMDGGRVGVFYSPEDVSVGLVGNTIGGVSGYVPSDATKVLTSIIAYAVDHKDR